MHKRCMTQGLRTDARRRTWRGRCAARGAETNVLGEVDKSGNVGIVNVLGGCARYRDSDPSQSKAR